MLTSITFKTLASHIALVTLACTAISVTTYHHVERDLKTVHLENLTTLAASTATAIQREIQQRKATLTKLATDSRAMDQFREDFNSRPLRAAFNRQLDQFDQLSYLNNDGQEELHVSRTQHTNPHRSFLYDELFLDAKWIPNTIVTALRLTDEQTRQQTTMQFMRVQKTFFDEFGGALRGEVEIATLMGHAYKAAPNPHKLIALLNHRQQLIYSNYEGAPRLGTVINCLTTHRAEPGEYNGTDSCLGLPAYVTRAHAGIDGWQLVVGLPVTVLRQPIHEINQSFAIITLLVIVLGTLIALAVSTRLTKPINALSEAATAISQGNMNIEVRVNSNDEIGDLAHAFNHMTARLNTSQTERDRTTKKIQALNHELNQRIDDLKLAQERITNLAFYDELTGLPNRRLLNTRLEQNLAAAKRREQQGALLVLDLDRFKNINDALGHAYGDSLLQQVAQRLLHEVRAEDTVARLGGDEFVVLLPQLAADHNHALQQAMSVAEKIRHALTSGYSLNGHEHHTSPSIGIVLFPHMGDTPEELLIQADTAMYRAKNEGGDAIHFYESSMQEAAKIRLGLEKGLRRAIQRQELSMVYQPQVDLHGNIMGLEALLRWEPEPGHQVPPTTFIPLAEETGLIRALGSWAMQRAMSEFQQMLSKGALPPFCTVSINISPLQFRQHDFADHVRSLLEQTQLTGQHLKLEITESAVMDDVARGIDTMRALKALGVQFSIDDFGTGYSSLAYLSRLPLDQLKIDRSFVSNCSVDTSAEIIVETIIAMGQHLGLEVIAEGVESDSELALLQQKGCAAYQGFLFSHPQTPRQLIAQRVHYSEKCV